MTYRFSKQADADIIKLYLDGLETFGFQQTERYQAGLLHCLENLASQPLMARERPEFRPPVRVHFYQAHVVVYSIQKHGILIIRVVHGKQDWERLL